MHLVTYEKCGHSSELSLEDVLQAQLAHSPLVCSVCGVTNKAWHAKSPAWRRRHK